LGPSGACAFLIGVGRITAEGFRVRQFFLRGYEEEASALDALASTSGLTIGFVSGVILTAALS
jgi:hypothetical protein